MRTLIVPCAGSRMVDGVPLFLSKHPNGMLLAEKTIEGVFPQNYDRIIYTILDDIDKEYNASEKLYSIMEKKYPIEIVVLQEKTSGPAETIYKTLIEANVEGEFVIRDSHAYVEIREGQRGNFIAGLDLSQYEKTVENLRSKSFIVLNEQRQVLDVVEKRFCSDIISAGLYGFKKASDYKLAYERLRDTNYPIKKLYASHIISYLIGYCQRVFHAELITEFEDWSTVAAWQKVQRENATCFIDMDMVCGDDIGINRKVIDKMSAVSKKGIRFVGFSSHYDLDTSELIMQLKSAGINIDVIVCRCTSSKIRRLILSEYDLNELFLEV